MAYKVPKGEEGLVHASVFVGPRLDSDTGEPTVRTVYKTNPRQFDDWLVSRVNLGYKVDEILHQPKDYKLPDGFKTEKQLVAEKKAARTKE